MASSKTKTEVRRTPFVDVAQHNETFMLTKLTAGDLVEISYVSVRGRDEEEGAVQRVLNPRRIGSLRDFTLEKGLYPNSIILNWVDKTHKLKQEKGELHVPVVPRSAQVIDGQHRVEGLREAIKKDDSIRKMEIPVVLYSGLDTRRCADIFLSINTEQKPVPKSLVYDLYGVASEHTIDIAAARAKDIAERLNSESDSPYFEYIRFPGANKGKFGVDLSTVVTALKPMLEEKGSLEQVGLKSLEIQYRALRNFFEVLRTWYGEKWVDAENPFLAAAGFLGAVEFFRRRVLDYCLLRKSFTAETMKKMLQSESADRVKREELKGLQGRAAMRKVSELLDQRFNIDAPEEDDFEV